VSSGWELFVAGLGAGASATALIGAGWVAVTLVVKGYRATFGSRRAQSKLLDRLACGSSVDFVESLYGVAQFISREDDREQRTYRLQSEVCDCG
jgi:hypothetical protein